MQNRRLGCLSATGMISAVIALLIVVGVVLAKGGVPFSPGPLNAQAGEEMLGGVRSHAEIGGECGRCHAAPWSGERMADRCVQCHTEIAQQLQQPGTLHGALMSKSVSLQCRACHPEHRGPTAPLTVMDMANFPHEAVGFSLKAHQKQQDGTPFACSDCHARDITTFDQAVCADCHRDLNGTAFVDAHTQLFGTGCLDCHDGVDSYGRNFDHNAVFRLEGKHAKTACSKCHLGARSLADLQSTPTECFDCHKQDDPHNGDFGTNCAACHTPVAWDQVNFDHSQTAFPLEGKHARVACEKCHVNKVFAGTPTACVDCHAKDDAHNGQFGTDCAACHTPLAWDQATFDHNKTNFPLTGKHAQVACEQCHVNNTFKGLSATCVSCHEDPVFHRGAFGTDCASCHSTNAWQPAKYRGSHPRIADEGGVGINHGHTTCRTCHPNTVYDYTCLACHSNNRGGDDDD